MATSCGRRHGGAEPPDGAAPGCAQEASTIMPPAGLALPPMPDRSTKKCGHGTAFTVQITRRVDRS